MNLSDSMLSLLACPETASAVSFKENQLVSDVGSLHYPIINDIPWLFKNPLHSMVDWTIKLNHFNQILSDEIRILSNDVKKVSGATKTRLQRLLEGKIRFQQQVSELVSPILTAKVASKPVYDALSDRPPHTQNLLSYEANLYRDWVWGNEENTMTAQLILDALSGSRVSNMLVLGAGSCRLAYDLHTQLNPEHTIANDINPLLLFAAKDILQGNGLYIEEFPMHPRSIEQVAIEHHIEPIKKQLDNFSLLFSDATQPAIKQYACDLVITPWLIDIQPFELEKFLVAVNQYVPEGGQWINFGSLVFNQGRDALCYSIEEVKGIALKAGFEIENIAEHEIPYLKSPFNAGYRMENVWCWRATKVKNMEFKYNLQNLPEWILDIDKPVPNTRTFQSFVFSHQLFVDIASKVDGKKSINDIARRFAKERSIDTDEALSMVKDFYLKIVRGG